VRAGCRALLCAALAASSPALAAVTPSLEIRQMLQSADNAEFGAVSETVWLQRWLPGADWQPAPAHHLFGELVLAYDSGRDGGSVPLEQNEGDVHQLFYRYKAKAVSATLGRQVWKFGRQRLVGHREGTNVRRRFDGTLLTLQRGAAQWSAYHGYHVDSRIDAFDDPTDEELFISGVEAQGELTPTLHGYSNALAYRDRRRDERRYAWELHVSSETTVALELEGIRQWGDSGGASINAYWLLAQASYPRGGVTWSLGASQASGDDGRHTGFEPLFAKVPYYEVAGIFAPSNLREAFVTAERKWGESSALALEARQLWRVSSRDALYGPRRRPLLPAAAAGGDRVATIATLHAEHRVSKALELSLAYSYLDASRLLEAAGLAPHSQFLELTLDYRL
jgi:hypothetical protein